MVVVLVVVGDADGNSLGKKHKLAEKEQVMHCLTKKHTDIAVFDNIRGVKELHERSLFAFIGGAIDLAILIWKIWEYIHSHNKNINFEEVMNFTTEEIEEKIGQMFNECGHVP